MDDYRLWFTASVHLFSTFFGIGGGSSLFIFILFMFAIHLFMPHGSHGHGGHRHNNGNHNNHEHNEKQSDDGSTEKRKGHQHH